MASSFGKQTDRQLHTSTNDILQQTYLWEWEWVIFLVFFFFQNKNVIPQTSFGDSTQYNKKHKQQA